MYCGIMILLVKCRKTREQMEDFNAHMTVCTGRVKYQADGKV